MNAPLMVEPDGETDPLRIAQKELLLVTANHIHKNNHVWTSMLACVSLSYSF